MKYCVHASIQLDTEASRAKIIKVIKDKLVNNLTGETLKALWGGIELTEYISEDGKPAFSFIVRFDKKEDMDELFALIKKGMGLDVVLKGSRVSKHHCTHDGGSGSCQDTWEEYVKE